MANDWDVVEERPVSEWDVVAEEPVRPGSIVAGRPARAEIPGVDPEWAAGRSPAQLERQRRAQVAEQNPIAERVVGAVEGALDIAAKLVGGGLGGMLGLAGAPLKAGPADQNMAEGAQAGVDIVRKGYGLAGLRVADGPQTQTGEAISGGFDKVMEGLPPVAGVFGTLAAPVAARPRALSARQAVQALPQAVGQTIADAVPGPVADAARQTLAAGREVASAALDRGMDALPERLRPASRRQQTPAPGTMASGGAAGTDAALQRRERAAALPVPMDLSEGQASRDFAQLRFENETAKNSAAGAPLRELHADQNLKLSQNLDALEELTGAQTASSYDAGSKVVQALAEKAGRAKARIDEAYAKARDAGDMAEPVPYSGILAYIEDTTPTTRDKLAPIIRAVEEQLRRNDPEGSGVVSVDALETVRQMVRANTEPGTPGGYHGGQLIKLIDEATKGAQGDLYKVARKLRADYGRQFEDRGVVADLLESKKGTDDRKVKLERVVERAVQGGGQDDLRFLRGLLVNEGGAGRQAWKEIQGRVIASFRDHAQGVGAPDIRGNPILSPAKLAKRVAALDADGKLEVLFDKKGAQLIRDLVETTQDVRTAPPGAVNMSHTSSALRDLWDQAVSLGVTGIPVRGLAVLQAIKKDLADRGVRKQVRAALPPKSDARPRTDLGGIFDAEPEAPAAARAAPAALPAPTREGPSDARLQEIDALREGASPETLRVLEAEAKRVRSELASRSKVAAQQTEVEALERAARAATNAAVKRALQARADALRVEKIPTGEARELDTVPVPKPERSSRIPVGEARELPPSTGRAPDVKPLPVGDVRELTRDQARQVAPTRRERDLLELRDEATDSVVIKELDAAIAQERRKAAEKARGREYLHLADAAKDPELREQFEAKAAELGVKRRPLPVGEATELPVTPGTARAVQAIKLNARDQAAWNALFRFGGLDSDTSGLMIAAARVDPMALDRALKQFEGKPALLLRELQRLVNGGK